MSRAGSATHGSSSQGSLPPCGGGTGRGVTANAARSCQRRDQRSRRESRLRRDHDARGNVAVAIISRRDHVDGLGFRRDKCRSAHYIVDFVCHSSTADCRARWREAMILTIAHSARRQTARCMVRRHRAIVVLRFTNEQVTLTNLEGVRGRSFAETASGRDLRRTPLPDPSPTRGEGTARTATALPVSEERCSAEPTDEIHPRPGCKRASRHHTRRTRSPTSSP